MHDTEFDRLTTSYFDGMRLKNKSMEESVGLLRYIVKGQLGPLLSQNFDWDQFETNLRLSLAKAFEQGVWAESGERTKDAQQASWNLLRGVLAGHALGSGDPEEIARAKEFCGVEKSQAPGE
ncbi:MAG: hypothetical protein UY48_C0042G0013 [Candidatus Gottesmanbacteria bacterium GW2011_GWB1_49_7]|uniref:Uncharacterized protein n=1 Tax=Candidatus Gottesmanbacteria bacterium GW2011_GWB1_49_7 TaxID=1618448 RepID=A0A0G1VUZ7_9BACT|nr:MAG: hypothetical protein UY48_C0042G0013 [Candidatus Gottesmanbacteria bacterium GW2011_GWB1_49_7]